MHVQLSRIDEAEDSIDATAVGDVDGIHMELLSPGSLESLLDRSYTVKQRC